MRWRRLMWLLVSVVVVALVWRWGHGGLVTLTRFQQPTPQAPVRSARALQVPNSAALIGQKPITLRRLAFRLSNTRRTLDELLRSDRAILLENALLDTGEPVELVFPEEFRRKEEPGSYIVQAR